jgi:hypothetical protein
MYKGIHNRSLRPPGILVSQKILEVHRVLVHQDRLADIQDDAFRTMAFLIVLALANPHEAHVGRDLEEWTCAKSNASEDALHVGDLDLASFGPGHQIQIRGKDNARSATGELFEEFSTIHDLTLDWKNRETLLSVTQFRPQAGKPREWRFCNAGAAIAGRFTGWHGMLAAAGIESWLA